MTELNPLLEKVEDQVAGKNLAADFSEKGEILKILDGVAIVRGLSSVMFSEIVVFENGKKGLVLSLTAAEVGVLILGDEKGLAVGQLVERSGEVLSVAVGEEFLGRVVDGLGNPLDGKWEIASSLKFPVERVAPGVMTRKEVKQPVQTGIKAIDALIPVGRGQRELIIGDRQTGKTTVAIDTILAQKNSGIKCIYVAIGQKESKIARLTELLREKGAMDYTIIVSAPANSPAVLQYLAPFVGCAMGEFFIHRGEDALIIYDDLSKHANAYREMSLLLKRAPGREAFPGDVFYLHSRLLERAARVDKKFVEEVSGGKVTGKTGSLTALPIVETQAGDVGAYIPTNVISITDGQIFLDSDLFNSGLKPGINVGISVSRVGGSAQTKLLKKAIGSLKLDLANLREMAAFAQFSSDLDKETLKIIERGKRMTEALKQKPYAPIPFEKQAALFFAGSKGFFDELELTEIGQFEEMIREKLDGSHALLGEKMRSEKVLSDEIKDELKNLAAIVLEEVLAVRAGSEKSADVVVEEISAGKPVGN